MNEQQAAYYLAAMIDGEGTVQHTGTANRKVAISNTEQDILDACLCACAVLGIRAKQVVKHRQQGHHKPCWDVMIRGRDDLAKLLELVPLQSERKRTKLTAVVASYRPKPPDRDTLHRMYVVEQFSAAAIGRQLGHPGATILKWLTHHDIERRTDAEAALIRHARERGER